MTETKDIRVEFKVRNNRILKLMELQGISSVAELCRRAGLCNGTQVGAVINLKDTPVCKASTPERPIFRRCVQEIAKVLKVPPDALFSAEQMDLALPSNRAHFEMDIEQARALAISQQIRPDLLLEAKNSSRQLDKILRCLLPREREVLIRRHGLGGRDPETLREIAISYDRSVERVRQIESKAIRKIRNRVPATSDEGVTLRESWRQSE